MSIGPSKGDGKGIGADGIYVACCTTMGEDDLPFDVVIAKEPTIASSPALVVLEGFDDLPIMQLIGGAAVGIVVGYTIVWG